MKQLQKSDLKKDEIYKQLDYNYIFLYNIDENSHSFKDGTAISTTSPRYYKRWTANRFIADMIEATPEEKHWLETCIKADQFVSYEEAMKTFIPEYVECISLTYPNMKDINFGEIGKIYKVLNYNYSISDMTINEYFLSVGKERFKPSTKEAYDAQFVVKEPEFVLPEIWWVRITKKNLKDISKFLDFNLSKNSIGLIAGMVKSHRNGAITKGYNSTPITSYGSTFGNEITYDQFKQYVLKENTTVTEKPKIVFEKPKDKVLRANHNSIVTVECSEGGVYKIGDKITVFTHDSPNKGKVFTIERFRWTNDKSKICAVTELHTPNGISLDKIELYVKPKVKVEHDFKIGDKISIIYDSSDVFIIENIEGNRLIINNEEGTLHNMHKSVLAKNAKLVEPKQVIIAESSSDMLKLASQGISAIQVNSELSLLEQTKLRYPIGTKIISPTLKNTHIIKGDIRYGHQNSSVYNYIFGNNGSCTLYNADTNQWAEIVDDFVLPEKWCVQVTPENQNFIKSVRDRSCSFTFITSDLILPDVKNSWYCYGDAKKRGFTEITLEQFKKYVLKDESI